MKLDEVKAGDEAIISHRGYSTQIVTVERVTKTRVLVNGGVAYRKKDGWRVGLSSDDRTWGRGGTLSAATPEEIEQVRAAHRRDALSCEIRELACANRLGGFDEERLKKIRALLDHEGSG